MKRLFAGPFVGEFGWELFCWQGILRDISKNYDHIHIVCMPGKEVLYQDFATTIEIWSPETYIPDGPFNTGITKDYPMPTYDCDYIGPNTKLTQYHSHNGTYQPNVNQQYVIFGNKVDIKYDIVLHARSTDKVGTENRNWPEEYWNELVLKIKLKYPTIRIASIGTKQAALHINNTTDLRDISLNELTDILYSSKLCIGPSSGPMHLASLCKTPHLVWSPEINRIRYNTAWNPHNTTVEFLLAENWIPSVQEVENLIIKML